MPSDIDVFNACKRHTSTALQKRLTLTARISNFRDIFAKICVAWPELFFRNWPAIFVPLNMSAIEMTSWPISTKEFCRTWGWNPWWTACQEDVHPTEQPGAAKFDGVCSEGIAHVTSLSCLALCWTLLCSQMKVLNPAVPKDQKKKKNNNFISMYGETF